MGRTMPGRPHRHQTRCLGGSRILGFVGGAGSGLGGFGGFGGFRVFRVFRKRLGVEGAGLGGFRVSAFPGFRDLGFRVWRTFAPNAPEPRMTLGVFLKSEGELSGLQGLADSRGLAVLGCFGGFKVDG